MAFEHHNTLLHRHVDLIADRYKAPRQMFVVAHHEPHGDHEVVDVGEDEGAAGGVGGLLLQEMNRLLAPVAAGVQMVGGVVAVVEAISVTLFSPRVSKDLDSDFDLWGEGMKRVSVWRNEDLRERR